MAEDTLLSQPWKMQITATKLEVGESTGRGRGASGTPVHTLERTHYTSTLHLYHPVPTTGYG